MAYYQCFKTVERVVYCSSSQFNSHAPAAKWVGDCMANHDIKANDLLGKPYEAASQPAGAVIWP